MTPVVLNSAGAMTFRRYTRQIDLPTDLERAVDTMLKHRDDGILLLEGGADIATALYGESITHASRPYAQRDARELFFYTMARRLRMPILGICRGHQLMATLEGGSLFQDMTRDLGVRHGGGHMIAFTPDTAFARLMKTSPGMRSEKPGIAYVNSLHHQSVKDVPPGAEVVAVAPDGVIEAIQYSFGLGVQWHPEAMGHDDMVLWIWEMFR